MKLTTNMTDISGLYASVVSIKKATESYVALGARHGSTVVGAGGDPLTLVTTIDDGAGILEIETWTGQHDPLETDAQHVARHIDLIVAYLATV